MLRSAHWSRRMVTVPSRAVSVCAVDLQTSSGDSLSIQRATAGFNGRRGRVGAGRGGGGGGAEGFSDPTDHKAMPEGQGWVIL